jgi:hypothetical protein
MTDAETIVHLTNCRSEQAATIAKLMALLSKIQHLPTGPYADNEVSTSMRIIASSCTNPASPEDIFSKWQSTLS